MLLTFSDSWQHIFKQGLGESAGIQSVAARYAFYLLQQIILWYQRVDVHHRYFSSVIFISRFLFLNRLPSPYDNKKPLLATF